MQLRNYVATYMQYLATIWLLRSYVASYCIKMTLLWIRSFYVITHNVWYVQWKVPLSSPSEVTSGVPQVSVQLRTYTHSFLINVNTGIASHSVTDDLTLDHQLFYKDLLNGLANKRHIKFNIDECSILQMPNHPRARVLLCILCLVHH